MTLFVRPASEFDAPAMANLLNQIIKTGGTTAITGAVSTSDLREWMTAGGDAAAWHVAEDEKGEVLGFQWIGTHPDLPPEACDIATFVQEGKTGLGIGSALFNMTRAAAQRLGYSWINANIRADNESGLIYYQSRGFEDYARKPNVRLANGQTVDKVLKRHDL